MAREGHESGPEAWDAVNKNLELNFLLKYFISFEIDREWADE